MSEQIDQDVREHMRRYLAGELPIADLHRFIMPRMRQFANAEPGTHPLTRRVALRLAEFSSGHWTEAQLREELAALAGQEAT